MGQEKVRGFLLLGLLRFALTWADGSTPEWKDAAKLAGDLAQEERAYAVLRRTASEQLERVGAPVRWAEARELLTGCTFTAGALRQRFSRYGPAVMDDLETRT